MFISQILAIHATTGVVCGVTYLKKNNAVILLTPISNKSNEGMVDCTRNKIGIKSKTSKVFKPGINHENMIKY